MDNISNSKEQEVLKPRSQALKEKRMRRNIVLFTTVGAAATIALIGVTVFSYFSSNSNSATMSDTETAEVDETILSISMATLDEAASGSETITSNSDSEGSSEEGNLNSNGGSGSNDSNNIQGSESLESMLEGDFFPSFLLSDEPQPASGVYILTSESIEDVVQTVAEALNVEGSIVSENTMNKNGVNVETVSFGVLVNSAVDYSKPHVVASAEADESSVIYWTYSVGGEVDYVKYGEQGSSLNLDSPESNNVSAASVRKAESYSDEVFEALGLTSYNTVTDTQNDITVVAELLLDGEPTPLYTALFFDNEGLFYGAYGFSASLSKIAEVGSLSALDAASRSNNKAWFGMSPANIYISHFTKIDEEYNEFQSTSKRLSDFISNGINTLSSSGLLAATNPTSPSQFEANGIIVEYYEDTLPDLESSNILGFENVEAPVNFTFGEKLGDTMWLVESSETMSKATTDAVLTTLRESGYFTQTAANYTVRFEDVYSTNGEDIVLDESEFTWVLFPDSEGNQYIAKGYFFYSSEKPVFYSSVMAIDDKYIKIER